MSYPPRPRARASAFHRATAGCCLALAATSGCGNSAGTAPAATTSTPSTPSAALGGLVSSLLGGSTVSGIVSALKSSNVIAALKKAWGAGYCKTEINTLTQDGLKLASKSGVASFLGSKTIPDLTGIKADFSSVASCLQSAAPEVLKAFETAVTSSISASSGTASKAVDTRPARLHSQNSCARWTPALWSSEPNEDGGAAAAPADEMAEPAAASPAAAADAAVQRRPTAAVQGAPAPAPSRQRQLEPLPQRRPGKARLERQRPRRLPTPAPSLGRARDIVRPRWRGREAVACGPREGCGPQARGVSRRPARRGVAQPPARSWA